MRWRIKCQSRRKNDKLMRKKREGKVCSGEAEYVTYQ